MTAVTVDIPENLDKKIAFLKIERKIGSKSSMIVKIIDEYFEEKERELEKLKKETGNWM